MSECTNPSLHEPVVDERNSYEGPLPRPESGRDAFERWVGELPYAHSINRWPEDSEKHAWPGQYKEIAVEMAWNAWCEALETVGVEISR